MRFVTVPADKQESSPTGLRGLAWPKLRLAVIGMLGTAVIEFVVWDASVPRSSQSASYAFTGGVASFVLLFVLANIGDPGFARSSEKAARERLRSAEQKLISDVIAQSEADVDKLISGSTRDDQLTLAALWDVTHSRLDLYHQIATKQARRSFLAAQAAAVIGFGVLIGLAVAAIRVHSTVGAITAGTLGAVSAALAGYIGRTFVRSQESAASHLRAYFDQPLEFSR
jgi:hypothetical protein